MLNNEPRTKPQTNTAVTPTGEVLINLRIGMGAVSSTSGAVALPIAMGTTPPHSKRPATIYKVASLISARLIMNEPKNIAKSTTIWLVAKMRARVSLVARSLNQPSDTMLVAAIQNPINIRITAQTHSLSHR